MKGPHEFIFALGANTIDIERMNPVGKTALVTGAARRVGRVIALNLAQAGADIVVHYNRSEHEARATAAEIKELGRNAHLLQADLSAPDLMSLLADESGSFPDIDILINNASVFARTPVADITLSDWDTNLNVNLRAPFLLAQHFGRSMMVRGYGKIINIADCAVRRPYRNYLPYLVSKAGLEMLTRVLALEFAPSVQVNTVAPGTVEMPEDAPDKLKELILRKTPLGRLGAPEDVAAMVLHLVEHGDFMTGGYYAVDGGCGIPG